MDTPAGWRSYFLDQLSSPFREECRTLLTEKDLLTPAVMEALDSWPTLPLHPRDFLEYTAHCMMKYPSQRGVEDWLAHLRPADLYLACACVQASSQALSAFDETYHKLLHGLARRFVKPPWSEEDLLQLLFEKLFVGSAHHPPKLASYAGQGFLENWLRVTASRTFLDALRKTRVQQHQEEAWENDCLQMLSEQTLDLELEFLKQEYRSQFKAAFDEAVMLLTPQQRNILRQYLVGGLSVDQLGALYNIHRSTAARRLASARQHLLQLTQQRLIHNLQISQGEYESIMRLIQSRLEVSLHRLLRIEEEGQVS